MIGKRSMIPLISMLCVLLCNPACAGLFGSVFDGDRQGFVFGGGIGAGVTLFSGEHGYWAENEGGIAYDFEIGYAPLNKYRICFMDRGMILTRGFAEKWREWNETVPVILPKDRKNKTDTRWTSFEHCPEIR